MKLSIVNLIIAFLSSVLYAGAPLKVENIQFYNKGGDALTIVKNSNKQLDTIPITFNNTTKETTFPARLHGDIDTAEFARNAGNAQTYLTTADCDTFVMWRNDSMFTVSRCDSTFPTLNPAYHKHLAETLPDSLKHHVLVGRIGYSTGETTWGTTGLEVTPSFGLGYYGNSPKLVFFDTSQALAGGQQAFKGSLIQFFNYSSYQGYGGSQIGAERTRSGNNSPVGFNIRSVLAGEWGEGFDYVTYLNFNDSIQQLNLNYDKIKMGGAPFVWKPVWIKNGGLKVSGKTILDSTPTITTATYALVDYNDTVANISMPDLYGSMKVSDSLNHHVASGYIPMSVGGKTWRSTGMYFDTINHDLKVPRYIFSFDSSIYIPFIIGRSSTYTDRNLDSGQVYLCAAGTPDASRGAWIGLQGEQAGVFGSVGNAIISSAVTGRILNYTSKSIVNQCSTFQFKKVISLSNPDSGDPIMSFGYNDLYLDDSLTYALSCHKYLQSIFLLQGGMGTLSNTWSQIQLGNGVSNKLTLFADTINLSSSVLDISGKLSVLNGIDSLEMSDATQDTLWIFKGVKKWFVLPGANQ
jgi:hypothetical protein